MKKVLFAIPLILLFLVPARSEATDSFFDSNGVRIRYKITGQGEPVVLVHGWAASADMWNPVVANLSRNYEVIALDCRGHGQSGKPHDPNQYGVEMVNDVV